MARVEPGELICEDLELIIQSVVLLWLGWRPGLGFSGFRVAGKAGLRVHAEGRGGAWGGGWLGLGFG